MAKTLKIIDKISFRGTGIHTGKPCEVMLRPGEDSGIFFDLPGGLFPIGSADCDGTRRGTRLTFPDGSEVLTVEHLIGSLAGLGVWSAVISPRGPEIPAMDGSGLVFSEGIARAAGPGEDMKPVTVTREIAFTDPSGGGFISVVPSDLFEITCMIKYETKAIGCQVFEGVVTPETFLEEIAPARTFVLTSEIESILERGLGQGGAADNVLVIDDVVMHAPGHLRIPDEPVRHKVLDLIGDLATVGTPLRGRVVAYRSGHDMHLELSRRIRRSLLSA